MDKQEMTLEERLNLIEYNLLTLTRAVVNLQEILIGAGAASIVGGQSVVLPVTGDPEQEIPTVNGMVKVKDIPLQDNGMPSEEWSIANCVCEKHTALREAAKASKEVTQDEPRNIGQYL